jgi:hypothetical protein
LVGVAGRLIRTGQPIFCGLQSARAGRCCDGRACIRRKLALPRVVPGGWTRTKGAGLAAVTGVAVASLNGVWVQTADADLGDISDLLDQVAATGLPHCLQLRPDSVARLAGLARRRGMAHSESIPLMAVEDPGQLEAAQSVSGLAIRELLPEEAQLHASVAAAGFEIPLGLLLPLITPEVLAAPGVRCYLGEAGGQPVTTGLGVRLGSSVAIFDIATPPSIAGAVMARP